MTKVRALLLCTLAAVTCANAGSARATLDVGITEDAGKSDGGANFFATLDDLGAKENRVSDRLEPELVEFDRRASSPSAIPRFAC